MKSPGSLKLVGSLEEDLCASHDNPRCYPVLSNAPGSRTKRARGTPLVAGQAVLQTVCHPNVPALLSNNLEDPVFGVLRAVRVERSAHVINWLGRVQTHRFRHPHHRVTCKHLIFPFSPWLWLRGRY